MATPQPHGGRRSRADALLAAPTLYGFIGRLPGEPIAFTGVFAWCPWCVGWHRHGDDTSRPGDVLHRYPHCPSHHSPYRATGYLVAVTNIPLTQVYGQMRRASNAQQEAIRQGQVTPAIERLRAQVLPMLRPDHHRGQP